MALKSQPFKLEQKTQKSGKRTYVTPNGDEYPSATTVLGVINKPLLVPWAAKQEREYCVEAAASLHALLRPDKPFTRPAYIAALEQKIGHVKKFEKEKKKAGEIGTEVHNRVEWELRKLHGDPVEDPPPLSTKDAKRAFATFVAWEKQVKFTPLYLEAALWSDEHRCAGTVDWICYVNDVLTVGDWKTGKRIYQEAWAQVSCYAHMAIERGLIQPPVQTCVVRLPKYADDPTAEVQMQTWEEAQVAFTGFVGCRALFDWIKGVGK